MYSYSKPDVSVLSSLYLRLFISGLEVEDFPFNVGTDISHKETGRCDQSKGYYLHDPCTDR